MSEKRIAYITVTYKLRLYDRHHDWLMNTRQLYNQVVWHYYQILIGELQLLEQSNYYVLRKLEEISIGTKEMRIRGEEPLWKLVNLPKIPLYFRRAAINTAIGLAKSYISSYGIYRKKMGVPSQATAIDFSPVFYKGMYREFHKDSIQLKLYNGKKWVWITYPYTGRKIPKEGKILSPTLKVEKKAAYLHIPVETTIDDIYTVKEQIKKESQICAVAFPDNNSLAVCAVIRKNGNITNSYFIRGGNAREAQRNEVLKRLEKSRKSRQQQKNILTEKKVKNKTAGRENAIFYKKLKQINQYYAHKVSREILDYCIKEQIKIIVVPNYENSTTFREQPYLNRNWFHWQGRSIIRNLKYKAFREGILVTTIYPFHISDCCSECGKKIQRYNEGHRASRNYYGGKLFFCPNGHKGNTALNTAKNIGRYFLRYFQEESLQDTKNENE